MSLEERWDKPKTPAVTSPSVPKAAQTASPSFVRRHARRITITPQQFPQFVSKRPELLKSLAARGAPLLAAFATSKMLETVATNEALARNLGLRAVYNSSYGNFGVSGWGRSFGEAIVNAERASDVTVSYLTQGEYTAGRAAAIAEDIRRGNPVVESAYQYTKTDPTRFQPFRTAPIKNILGGISKAADALQAFTMIPLDYMMKQGLPEPYRDMFVGGQTKITS